MPWVAELIQVELRLGIIINGSVVWQYLAQTINHVTLYSQQKPTCVRACM